MPVRALFFDLDDTLLETYYAHEAALGRACAQAAALFPGWTGERLRAAFTTAYRCLERDLEAGKVPLATQSMFRSAVWQRALDSCGLDPAPAEQLAGLYLDERRRRYQLYEDVTETLDRLRHRYSLVLVTNGLADIQREKVRAVELERWIPSVVVSGEVGSWKPDPGVFRHALALAGAAPDEAVMVGDSLRRDIAGAQAAGLRAVWIRRHPHLETLPEVRPDAEVTDLDGLCRVLERLG